jgi:peptide-methionine (S)-S-oxide reductase
VFFSKHKSEMVTANAALPGRAETMPVPSNHFVNGAPLEGPWPDGMETIVVGMGCFWGAERKFWQLAGVYSTAVGYAGGFTPNPTYEETCTGRTGHVEVVLVVFDPAVVSVEMILKTFWEGHNPTEGMRQGNDVGTVYRSAIYVSNPAHQAAVDATREMFAARLADKVFDQITTEIAPLGHFYYAEPYHQQYLGKNPNGYCGLGGTGVTCPIGVGA